MHNEESTFERIAFIKTGWAEYYQGDKVIGRHRYINQKYDAHEKYNFKCGPNGRFYGYAPPIGYGGVAPNPDIKDGWLIIFTAAHEGSGPLLAVGWYERAQFLGIRKVRPEYAIDHGFPFDTERKKYVYCVSALKAFLIPVNARSYQVPSTHFQTTPILYARGHKEYSPWREKYAHLAENIVRSAKSVIPK